MSRELTVRHTDAKNIYFVLRQKNQAVVVSTHLLGDYLDASWTTYAITGTEVTSAQSTVVYTGDVPPGLAKGSYIVEAYERVGATAAITDHYLGSATIDWSGTAEMTLSSFTEVTPEPTSGLATETKQDAAKLVLDALPSLADIRKADLFTRAFTAGVLANAPTGATASYAVSTATVGAAPNVDIVAYQYAAFGPFTITAQAAQTGDSHAMLVYDTASPSVVLWSLTTAGGEISVGGGTGTALTLTDTDAHTGTAGVFAYVLRNTTDDTVICEGSLTIEERPNVPTT